MRGLRSVGLSLAATVLLAAPARAQFNGSHTLGDFGVQSGTQPSAGFYTSGFYYRYSTDSLRDRNGDEVTLSPDQPGNLSINAYAAILWYVSKTKVLGANYGAMAVVPIANGSLEAPAFGLDQGTGTHLADLYLRPIDLGWHKKQADFAAGFGVYTPTGEYEQGGSSNTGKGMWSYEPFAGMTLHLDAMKSWSLATNAFWETHGTKKDTDVKVGQILTLEGGLGKSYLGGGLIIGAGYYAQWKVTPDSLGTFTLPGGGTLSPELNAQHKVFALGPDLTFPVASKTKLYALVNLRYFWEFGARTKTQGPSLVLTATFPIPSVKLN